MKDIHSLQELREITNNNKRSFLLIYKSGLESSDCAYNHLNELSKNNKEDQILYTDVNSVKDIHTAFNISSAPSFLVFSKNKLLNTYKGCNSKDFFKNIIEDQVFRSENDSSKAQKSVTVYSSSNCPWCTKLKSYLNKNNIRYRDINVASSPNAAEELVRKTGQQGVPQSNIGGEWIVGFDKVKIDRLLNINT